MSNATKPILNYAMIHTIRMHSDNFEPFLSMESAPKTTIKSISSYALFGILTYFCIYDKIAYRKTW